VNAIADGGVCLTPPLRKTIGIKSGALLLCRKWRGIHLKLLADVWRLK
jgi:hypothetical protein